MQSLKNLADPSAVPMVAIRSAGLAFESVIGLVRSRKHTCCDPVEDDGNANQESGMEGGQREGEEIIEALVTEEYVEMLVEIANHRFVANRKRMKRFEETLFKDEGKKEWEDGERRRERKRREGLEKREEVKRSGKRGDGGVSIVSGSDDDGDGDVELGIGNLEQGI